MHGLLQFYRFCSNGGHCTTWSSALDALIAEEECLKRDENGNTALDVLVALTLASHCNYTDAACSIVKTGNKSTGYCYYEKCGALTTIKGKLE